jgi:hypothetical protein
MHRAMSAGAADELFMPQRLEDLPVLREILERLEGELVLQARMIGDSWTEIGAALGVTRQSVHRKHAAGVRAERARG